jgi:hypothetical protein
MTGPRTAHTPGQAVRGLPLMALAAWLATGIVSMVPHLSAAEEPSTGTGASQASPAEPSRDNWRTREILDAQRRSTGPIQGTTGTETGAVLDSYHKSISKGGAGADLPPRNTNGSSTR